MEEEKITPLLAFMAGVLVAKNWPKIEKLIKPYLKTIADDSTAGYSSLATFLARQKEKVEDMMAESEIKKKEVAGGEAVTTGKNHHPAKDLAKQVVNKHPEGIPLQKIAEEAGVHPVRLARPVKKLLEENEIRKEGKLYFPIG